MNLARVVILAVISMASAIGQSRPETRPMVGYQIVSWDAVAHFEAAAAVL